MVNRTSWAVLAGILLVGLAPGLSLLAIKHGSSLGREGLGLDVAVVATLIAAAFVRQTAWTASLGAAVFGAVLGVVLIAATQEAVQTPSATMLLPKGLAQGLPIAIREERVKESADLALLRKGVQASEAGHPLVAPEGGLLVPKEISPVRGLGASLRYVGARASLATTAVWRQALAKQEARVEATQQQGAITPSASVIPWLQVGLHMAGVGLLTAVLANLVALASRRIAGGTR